MHLPYRSFASIIPMSCPPSSSELPRWGKTETPQFQKPAKIKKTKRERSPHKEEQWIVCRQCQKHITRPSERSRINGAHQHTFANPSGIVFEIGCFLNARNCSLVGYPSTDFAWFAGHTWQVTICTGCLTHLGWLFTSQQGLQFYGLILDRLSVASSN